jgi:two-component system, LuxR family, response regulator FixJ
MFGSRASRTRAGAPGVAVCGSLTRNAKIWYTPQCWAGRQSRPFQRQRGMPPATMQAETSIYIVDDDEAVRDSLQVMLEASGFSVRSFNSGESFLAALSTAMDGCVLLDVNMPGMSGFDVQARLAGSGLPVIVITGHGDVPSAVKAMKAGAVDFVEKPYADTVLLDAIKRALIQRDATKRTQHMVSEIKTRLDRLTPREREVFEQLVLGHPNKIIAHTLTISPRTVEIHRSRVMEKMQARHLSELVRMALAVGIEGARE